MRSNKIIVGILLIVIGASYCYWHYILGPSGEVPANDKDVEPLLGDKPGDVVRIDLPPPIGTPLALPDRRIMLWSTAGDIHKQSAVARFSNDNDLTWSEPRALFDFPRDRGAFSGGASLVSRSGIIHLFGLDYYNFNYENWFNDRQSCKSFLWHSRSTDGGKTWSPIQYVPFGLNYTGASNNAFQLSSGRILVPISALSNRTTSVFVSVVPYSDDDGATWHVPPEQIVTNTGASDWYESGAVEPVGIELKDGRVWLLLRSQDGYQWETFSEDGGLHWSPPRHTRFICNQSAMAVLRLRDGRLILFWNNCGAEGLGEIHWGNAERAVMAAALSSDEGKTWVGYREVGRVTENAQISYPYVTQAPDGHVLLSAAGHLMRINPEFLTNMRFTEDFSGGVRRWSILAAKGVEAVPDPDLGSRTLLRMRKPNADVPAGACLNFPYSTAGELTIILKVEPGFQGAHLTLSDHYDLPGLPRDGSFPSRILPSGRLQIISSGGSWLATPGDLTPGVWHEIHLQWNCSNGHATLHLNGTEVARIEQFVRSRGVCYLRLRSLAETTDQYGLYVKSVSVKAVP